MNEKCVGVFLNLHRVGLNFHFFSPSIVLSRDIWSVEKKGWFQWKSHTMYSTGISKLWYMSLFCHPFCVPVIICGVGLSSSTTPATEPTTAPRDLTTTPRDLTTTPVPPSAKTTTISPSLANPGTEPTNPNPTTPPAATSPITQAPNTTNAAPSGLSDGEIAGIAVGSLAGVGALGELDLLPWCRI